MGQRLLETLRAVDSGSRLLQDRSDESRDRALLWVGPSPCVLSGGSVYILQRDDIRRNGCVPANLLTVCYRSVAVRLESLVPSGPVVYPVEIRTTRLCIREFASNDVDGLLNITSHPEVVRYLSFGPASSAEAAALLDFALASAHASPRAEYVLAIDDGAGMLVGSCGFHEDNGISNEREVYFVLARDAWGRGLGLEALQTIVDFGFGVLGLDRIYGVAHPDNAASIRVMERAGLTYDGEVEEAFEDAEGWRAGRRYAILRA